MNDEKPVNERGLKWLREQMNMACDMSESVETMRRWGYSDPAILDAFEAVRPRGNALLQRRDRSATERDLGQMKLRHGFRSGGKQPRLQALSGPERLPPSPGS